MCQLLGLNCNTPTDVSFSFTGFAMRSGLTDHHADGWGIAFFEGTEADRGLRHFVDHLPAYQSPIARLVREYPIKSRHVIAHIRKATQGTVALENTHPFVRELWGRYWVFAHNGNLKDFAPRLDRHFRPVGDTDSEYAFCYIMQELDRRFGGEPSVDELSNELRRLARRWRRTAPSTSCSRTVWHCGRTAAPICASSSASTRFATPPCATAMSASTLRNTPSRPTGWR